MRPVVADTNRLFSALLRSSSPHAQTLRTSKRRFFVNELVLTELFKHKERIVQHSALADEEVITLYHDLMRQVEFYKEALIAPAHRTRAYELCRGIDETDAPHVALALELGGELWTGDENLKTGLQEQGFDAFFEPPGKRSERSASPE